MSITRRILLTSVSGLTLVLPGIRAMRTPHEPAGPVGPQQAMEVPPFTSVELRGGVKAVLQFGTVQRVTLVKGSAEISGVRVASGEQLIIDRCQEKCPRGYRLEVEIVTPVVAAISIGDGGIIEGRGNFPRRAEIGLAVSNGGTIDARAISAGRITAAVTQGGGILAKPETSLLASVVSGGVITYWGDVPVTSSTQHGGQIIKGSVVEADKPVADFASETTCPEVPPTPKHISTGEKRAVASRVF